MWRRILLVTATVFCLLGAVAPSARGTNPPPPPTLFSLP